MKSCNPNPCHIRGLRELWKEAFGDTDAFLDIFFGTAFHRDRCRCICVENEVAAALYWFGCTLGDAKYAYIYAVATAKAHRGKGLCHALMKDTLAQLAEEEYAGAVLVPQELSLRDFYAGMGYRDAGGIKEFTCTAGEHPLPLRAIGREEFALRRRRLLPPGGLVQEGENLLFLEQQVQFYTGEGFLLSAWEHNGVLHGEEYLGDSTCIPGILRTLGCREGTFRTPGEDPFAMFLPLQKGAAAPGYLGFSFA